MTKMLGILIALIGVVLATNPELVSSAPVPRDP